MSYNSDCLVLHIEEFQVSNGKMDHSTFIIYDSYYNNFIIRGKRSDTNVFTTYPYSFTCDKAKNVVSFLQHIMCLSNKLRITIYNYDNLPSDSSDITYEFLSDYIDESYEIVGYNNSSTYSKKELMKMVELLKNTYNYY